MNKVNSFVKQFCAIVTGDTAKVTAEKVKRSADSALSTQIAIKTGETISLEEAVEDAKENLMKARVNYGREMKEKHDRENYVSNLIEARNKVVQAEEALENHKELLSFLKAELKNLESQEVVETAE